MTTNRARSQSTRQAQEHWRRVSSKKDAETLLSGKERKTLRVAGGKIGCVGRPARKADAGYYLFLWENDKEDGSLLLKEGSCELSF